MPQDTRITFCGAQFDIIHTPGHTLDHICVRTPDDVFYLADAIMTGKTLHYSKFPYFVSPEDYFASMENLKREKASVYFAAHEGAYDNIGTIVDEAREVLSAQMRDYLALVYEGTNAEQLTSRICQSRRTRGDNVGVLSYYNMASQAYLNYFREIGWVECYFQENRILYRRT